MYAELGRNVLCWCFAGYGCGEIMVGFATTISFRFASSAASIQCTTDAELFSAFLFES